MIKIMDFLCGCDQILFDLTPFLLLDRSDLPSGDGVNDGGKDGQKNQHDHDEPIPEALHRGQYGIFRCGDNNRPECAACFNRHVNGMFLNLGDHNGAGFVKGIGGDAFFTVHHLPGHSDDVREVFAVVHDGISGMAGNRAVNFYAFGADHPRIARVFNIDAFQIFQGQAVKRYEEAQRAVKCAAAVNRHMKSNAFHTLNGSKNIADHGLFCM